MTGMNSRRPLPSTIRRTGGNYIGRTGQRNSGQWGIATLPQESRFSACRGSASTTAIVGMSTTRGNDIGRYGRTGCSVLSTAFISDSSTRMDSRHEGPATRYDVPSTILIESAELLRSLSGGVRESVILWAGTVHNRQACIRRIVVPRQLATPKHFEVPLDERHRIARDLSISGERLLAQLHTHPGVAFHSRTDDRLALPRRTGAISIVVPDFAASWDGNLREASVNRHLGGGVWMELSIATVTRMFGMP